MKGFGNIVHTLYDDDVHEIMLSGEEHVDGPLINTLTDDVVHEVMLGEETAQLLAKAAKTLTRLRAEGVV